MCIVLLTIAARAQGPSYPYSVTNTWTPSISKNAVGYFVYRSPFVGTCGTFAKLFTTALPATATSYTDQNPAEGGYCYTGTAINGSGVESGFSNIASGINVPLPPPTGFGAIVATSGGKSDVIYSWANPKGALTANSIYCGGRPAVKVFFPTQKVRVTSPAGTNFCAVTASDTHGESGLSKQVQVIVP